MGYSLLQDVTVVEVSQYGPDAFGGVLADLGARVIKVEPPRQGDPLRRAGALAAGDPNGYSYLHLRWNRGKESIELDLGTSQGQSDFRKLCQQADIVVEGMRAGVLERYGLGYEALKSINPKLVYCSVSGMGRSGPYHDMASHGPSFDAFGGLGMPLGDRIGKYDSSQPTPIGMHAVSLHAALGALAAVISARRTGKGTLIEVSAAESAAHWLPDSVDPILNETVTHERPGFLDRTGRMKCWARMENYRSRDGKLIFIQSLTAKSWRALLDVLERPDLQAIYEREPQTGTEDSEVAAELARILSQRTRDEWMALFRAANVAAMPVNSLEDLVRDPHFVARKNTYTTRLPDGTELQLTSTPIRVDGEAFSAAIAPELGEHNKRIRREFGLGDAVPANHSEPAAQEGKPR